MENLKIKTGKNGKDYGEKKGGKGSSISFGTTYEDIIVLTSDGDLIWKGKTLTKNKEVLIRWMKMVKNMVKEDRFKKFRVK